ERRASTAFPRADRALQSGAQCLHHRDRGAGARRRAKGRSATRSRRSPAARRPADRAQGPVLHRRCPHHLRLENALELRRAVRRRRGRAARPGRRRDARQDEHGRVRDGLLEREQLVRTGPQSVGSAEGPGRLVRRLGGCGRRTPDACCHGHRHRRLDPSACCPHRSHGLQADLRPRVALRNGRVRIEPRSGRRADAASSRRRDAARAHGGLRPARLDQRRHARARLSRRPRAAARGPEGRSPQRVLRQGSRRSERKAGARRVAPVRDTRREAHRSEPAEPAAVGAGVLRRRTRRVLVEPVTLRRRALRSSLRESDRSDGPVQALARRRLRRRGQATHHDGHVRPLCRLLRRLLPARAESAALDHGRLRARLQAGRRADGTDVADGSIRHRREGRRSGDDVSQRHLHHRREPRRLAGRFGAVRVVGRIADRAAGYRAAFRRSEAAQRRALVSARDRVAQACSAGLRMTWETVIGLEIHAQLATGSKIFSSAPTAYGAAPNTQANLVDLGYPGVLPVLNREAVRMAVKFGLAVGATVARRSVFARKNYFYPDLPKGYQISQYEMPIVAQGRLEIVLDDGTRKMVGITRAHLEEDAGKSLHEDFHGQSGIDLNRAGTPLLEIVSEPDMRSAKEAVAYLKKVHTLVRYLEICDGNMQEGSFRCDANVSVRPVGAEKLGTRAEIKNLNSFRFIEKAINYEVARQIDVIESGGKIRQETRLYDPDKGETRALRSKEEANDYRYFPDPDLLPVALDEAFIEAVRATLPELPDEKAARYMEKFGLSLYDAGVLTASREMGDYYEAVVSGVPGHEKLAANWVMGELSDALNKDGIEVTQ